MTMTHSGRVRLWVVVLQTLCAAAVASESSRPAPSEFVTLPVQRRLRDGVGTEQVVRETWRVPREEVALVTMHLWNFGEIGGPIVPDNICVADGTLANALRARRIDWVHVRPALTAARRAGLQVIHAQPGFVALKYPQHQALVAGMAGTATQPVMTAPALRDVTPDEMKSWTAENWPQRMNLDFPPLLMPAAGEPIVKTKEELDHVLKQRRIKTLIYVGYATDCCVIKYHCGLEDMVSALGYRACVLREATLATECPGGDGVANTATALERIEREFGGTASVHDFRDAILPPRHNILSSHVGWVASRPGQSPYPAEISEELLRDWQHYFPYMREAGFNEVGIFCFLTYNLPVPLGVGTKGIGAHANDIRITQDQVRRCREMIRAAHASGVKLYYGLGLYSWNVSDIRDAYPEMSPGGRVLCGMYPGDQARGIPASQQLMKDAVDFIVRELPELDGWWLTSGDHGRCTCPGCNRRFGPGVRGNVEYFLATDIPIIRHIREKYPRMTIAYCTEVMNEGIEEPGNFDILRQLAGACDLYLWGNLQKEPDATVRRLVEACPRTGVYFYQRPWQSTPPTTQERDGWFMPNAVNPLGRDMHRRRAVIPWAGLMACTLPKDNPADELSMRFMTRMMDEPDRDPTTVYRELLQAWYAPRTQGALDELLLVFTEAEDAFRQRWPSWFMHIDMVPTRLGTLDPRQAWTPETAVGYINAHQRSLARLRSIAPELQNKAETARLDQSIVKWIRYMKGEMRTDWKYEMP